MKDEQRIKALEEEVKVLKNEIQTVLLDLREQYLNLQNPFNYGVAPSVISKIADTEAEKRDSQPKAEEPKGAIEAEVDGGNVHFDGKAVGTQIRAESPTKLASDAARLWEGTELRDEGETDTELPPREIALPSSKRKKETNSSPATSKIDLVVIAGLTQWIDQATAKLGKERTEILIEMFFAMGRLPEKIKDALIRMTRLSHHESQGQSINPSDYLAFLAQLENLLADSKQQEKALLSILSMMKDSRDG